MLLKIENLGEHRRDLRLKCQFNHRMNLQRERERERERERRALNVRDSRNESKTNIQREREREIGKIY